MKDAREIAEKLEHEICMAQAQIPDIGLVPILEAALISFGKQERDRMLALLRSDEAREHIWIPRMGQFENDAMANWLESKLKEKP